MKSLSGSKEIHAATGTCLILITGQTLDAVKCARTERDLLTLSR
jgi:hypothetical protein